MAAVEHPLQRAWSLLWQVEPPPEKAGGRGPRGVARRGRGGAAPAARSAGVSAEQYLAGVCDLGFFETVEGFWGCHAASLVGSPDTLPENGNFYLFERGVAPTWEHEANARGGRWFSTVDGLGAEAWLDLCLGLIGETLDPDGQVTGAVLSRRRSYLRVALWTRDREWGGLQELGRRAAALLGIPRLEYQDHGSAYGAPSRHSVGDLAEAFPPK